jgi:hypothetical protein
MRIPLMTFSSRQRHADVFVWLQVDVEMVSFVHVAYKIEWSPDQHSSGSSGSWRSKN